MLKPMFAKGKDLERVLEEAAGPGYNLLICSDSSDFSCGDHIFVAEADGSELEYMGLATSTGDPPWIETTLSLKQALVLSAQTLTQQ